MVAKTRVVVNSTLENVFKSCVLGVRFHLIRVDGKAIRKGKVAFSSEMDTCGGALVVLPVNGYRS